MDDVTPSFPDVLLWAIPVFIAGVLLEFWYLKKKGADYSWRDGITSMVMGTGMTVSDILMKLLVFAVGFGFMLWLWQFRVLDWGYGAGGVIAAFIIKDFVYYWKHRWYHKVRWWWGTHVVHHSSEKYNLTTALRQPWSNHISGDIILSLPLVILGFHPLVLAYVGALNLLYQYWIHTELIRKMPRWFEAVMNTPSHHRVHHATNPRYLDANFAGTFIIWDKMFGTFVPEMDEVEDIRYGIVKPVDSYNPFKVAFHEIIAIVKDVTQPGITLKDRWNYIFAPPGWSHDGSRDTIASLKAAYVAQHPDQAGTPGLEGVIAPSASAAPAE